MKQGLISRQKGRKKTQRKTEQWSMNKGCALLQVSWRCTAWHSKTWHHAENTPASGGRHAGEDEDKSLAVKSEDLTHKWGRGLGVFKFIHLSDKNAWRSNLNVNATLSTLRFQLSNIQLLLSREVFQCKVLPFHSGTQTSWQCNFEKALQLKETNFKVSGAFLDYFIKAHHRKCLQPSFKA